MTLDQYLKDEKISQRDFARVVELSPSYLNEIVSGSKVPPLVTAYRIQRATGGKVLMSALLPEVLRAEASAQAKPECDDVAGEGQADCEAQKGAA